jgi:RND family efflux transporter MFP subunit
MAQSDLSGLKIEKHDIVSRPRRVRKAWYIGSGVVVVCLIVALYWAGILAPSIPVRVATISKVYPSQTFTTLNASGYVVAQRKSSLASKVTGRLVWLGVEEGSRVKAGDVIARLENQDVVAAAEQARYNLRTAAGNLDQAKAELADARLALRRAKELSAKGYIARADYDTALARHNKAVAGVAAGEATVRSSAAALKAAEVAVEYTLIRAPFDAVVLTKNADVGDIVTPIGAAANAKSAVVSVADMGSLKVEADVAESSLRQVKLGQPCEIQLDAVPDTRFAGKVHMIVPTADRTKATVMVKVGFLDRDARLLPEMSAKVAFLSRSPSASEQTPRTAVNSAALVTRNGRSVVYIIDNGRAVETPVVTGGRLGDAVELRSGAVAGKQVVMNPPKRLKNGAKVKAAEK